MTVLRAGAATDVGLVRSVNQDRYLVAEPLFAVADGMGGHAAGDVASLTALEALRAAFEADATADGLAQAVHDANRAVWDRAHEQRDLRGMGTTVTAVAVVSEGGDDVLAIVNVGDSRAYLLRDGRLDQVTEDHSVPEELRRAGRLSQTEAAAHPQRNVLTRALGVDADVEVDCFRVIPYRGDRLALASDGLFNEVDHDDIARVLRREPDPEAAARELVRLARDGGGNDNITVVVVDVVDDGDRAGQASRAVARPPTTAAGRPERPEASPASAPPASAEWRAPPGPVPGSPRPPDRPERPRVFTARSVAFLVGVVVVLGAALGAIGWFARAGYFVGADGEEVVIYKGRPGGLLWFSPTVADRTEVVLADMRASRRDEIRTGREASSLEDARAYVANNQAPTTTTTTSTTTTTTLAAVSPGAPGAGPVTTAVR